MDAPSEARPACRGCGGPLELWPTAPEGPLAACRGCGLVQAGDRLTAERAAALYSGDYLERLPREPDAREMTRLRRPLELAARLAPPPGEFLEIGCGWGWLLAQARQAGYRTRGTELNPHAAAHAAAKWGLEVTDQEADRLKPPEGGFDVICLRHVLEHVDEPRPFLAGLRRLLSPRGVLVGALPNIGSFKARLDGPDWCFLMTPHHRCHYTPATLRSMLSAAGFEPLATRTAELVLYDRALFQRLLNRIRRSLGRPPAPEGYDPAEVTATSPVTWLLAREHLFHRALARLGRGEEIVWAARPANPR